MTTATKTKPVSQPAESFAELGARLFSKPCPTYEPPVVLTPQMRHDSDAALSEFGKANDQVAFIRFHTEQQREWGAVVAREQAARLAEIDPLT